MPTVPVFYRPEMVADSGSFSPSAAKPRQVVERWQARGLPIQVEAFDPATEAQLLASHDPAYVRGILRLEIKNGFGNRRPDVAASLPWTSGAMIAAAREARRSGGFACAPVSGFHHAHYRYSDGYCTFNGLTVTALALRRDGARKVGILDADMHHGDGTEDVIATLGLRPWLSHVSLGLTFERPAQADTFLRQLPGLVEYFKGCDVLLYQAGADPHIDDPFGGWLTTEQLLLRDQIVFSTAARMGIPVAWNLAGGYQYDTAETIDPVLLIHENTMRVCTETQSG